MGVFNYDGTKNGLPNSLIPITHTLPTVTTFDEVDSTYSKKDALFDVPKAGVENADAGLTMDALFAQLNGDISAFISADVDFIVSDIDAHGVLTRIENNFNTVEERYTDVALVYHCHITYFVKIN